MAPKFAIASLSLGNCAHHQLPTKIRTASSLGYDGIEIFIPDFEAFVDEVRNKGLHQDLLPQPPSDDDELEVACAKAIASLCASLNLEIPVLQPLRAFENFASPNSLGGGAGLPSALKEAERWLRLMPHLNTRLLLVCSNYIEPEDHPFAPFDPKCKPVSSLTDNDGKARTTPPGPAPSAYYPAPTQEQLSSYLDAQVEAFRELGKVAAHYHVRIGYEPLAWGTMVDNWEQVWDVVRRVHLENVGVILDSFNCLANQYADPTVSPTFLRNPDSCSQTPIPEEIPISPSLTAHIQPQNPTHAALLQNLSLLGQTIPAHKIFLYQVADAALPCPPPGTITTTPRAPARMTWSRASRLFPFEETRGAWLPVTDFSLAVVEAGYPAAPEDYGCSDQGDAWWSLEVFNKTLMDERPECVEEHGLRGIQSLRTLWESVTAEIKGSQLARSPTPSQSSSEEIGTSDSSEGIQTPPLEHVELSKGNRKWLDGYIVE
ncbi:xylose isomerase-like protein [Roridomyces roridus]|uniref:Xylose isomerase-like protein n=1 Tax=Roridomyces roridus TaxID=1738132 RepID=A0AAD7BR76_9AGAR|nr:xylose isomerase-like protein [Roridomyces roridus]